MSNPDATAEAMVAALAALDAWMRRHTTGAALDEGQEIVSNLLQAIDDGQREYDGNPDAGSMKDAFRAAMAVRGFDPRDIKL